MINLWYHFPLGAYIKSSLLSEISIPSVHQECVYSDKYPKNLFAGFLLGLLLL